MNRLEMTDPEWYQLILDTLLETLGPFGLKRFLAFAKAGMGDKAAKRREWVDELEKATLMRGMQASLCQREQLLPTVQGGNPLQEGVDVVEHASCTSDEKRDSVDSLRECHASRAVNEPPKDISQLTDCEVHQLGLDAVSKELGLPGLFRLSLLCTPGTGNYTLERRKWLSQISKEEFLAQIFEARKAKQRSGKE